MDCCKHHICKLLFLAFFSRLVIFLFCVLLLSRIRFCLITQQSLDNHSLWNWVSIFRSIETSDSCFFLICNSTGVPWFLLCTSLFSSIKREQMTKELHNTSYFTDSQVSIELLFIWEEITWALDTGKKWESLLKLSNQANTDCWYVSNFKCKGDCFSVWCFLDFLVNVLQFRKFCLNLFGQPVKHSYTPVNTGWTRERNRFQIYETLLNLIFLLRHKIHFHVLSVIRGDSTKAHSKLKKIISMLRVWGNHYRFFHYVTQDLCCDRSFVGNVEQWTGNAKEISKKLI